MQEMPDKNFNPPDAENLDQEQLHPKIFETFSRQCVTCPCSMTLALPLQSKKEAKAAV